MAELKLSTAQIEQASVDPGAVPPKKKSGCGCFLIGCFSLLALILLPIIGGVIYIYSLDDAEWGEILISGMQNDIVAEVVKEAINQDTKMTPDEKKAALAGYESLNSTYNALSADQKKKVNENLMKVIKMAFINPDALKQGPPPELLEIISILTGVTVPITAPDTTSTTSTATGTSTGTSVTPLPQPSPTPSPTPSPSPDPFSFDLPMTPSPSPGPSPTPAPSPSPSNFDF